MRGALVLLAALLLVPSPARADFVAPIGSDVGVLAPAGDGAVLDQGDGLTFVSAAGTKHVAPPTFWIGLDGSETRVAAISGDLVTDTHTGFDYTRQATVWLGTPGARLHPVLRCRTSRGTAPGPVVSGPVAAWRNCAGRSVVVRDGKVRKAFPAGGRVAAITARDRTVTWVALRAAAPTRVRTVDLSTGTVRDVGRIKRYSPEADLSVDSAPDGRVAVSSFHPLGSGSCRTYLATAGHGFVTLPTRDCEAGTLDAGRVTLTRGSGGAPDELVLHDADGTTRLLARAPIDRVVQSPTRVVFVRRGCRRPTLTGLDLAGSGPPVTGEACAHSTGASGGVPAAALLAPN